MKFTWANELCAPVSGYDKCINGFGLVIGTYLHGSFWDENIRYAVVSYLRGRKGIEYAPQVADSELYVYEELSCFGF